MARRSAALLDRDGGRTVAGVARCWRLLRGRSLLILALLMAALIPLLLDGLAPFRALADFPLPRLALMLGLVFVCWNLNALRLRLMLAGQLVSSSTEPSTTGPDTTPPSFDQRRALAMVMATECATCATPGGGGGPLTLMMLLGRHGLRPARASALFLVDQACDMLFFLLALAGMAGYVLLLPTPWPRPELIQLAGTALLTSLMLLAVLLLKLPWVLRLTGEALNRRGPSRWLCIGMAQRRRLTRQLLLCRQGVADTLRQPPARLVAVFALCSGHWLIRYSLLYLTLEGLGVEVAWGWTFMVQMMAMAAGQLSLLPGGAGGVELTLGAFLLPLVGHESTAAAILIWRFVTYHWYLLAGAPVLAWLARRRQIGSHC